MRVKVKLFANFRDGRFVVQDQEYPQGTRIADIIKQLGISSKKLASFCLKAGMRSRSRS